MAEIDVNISAAGELLTVICGARDPSDAAGSRTPGSGCGPHGKGGGGNSAANFFREKDEKCIQNYSTNICLRRAKFVWILLSQTVIKKVRSEYRFVQFFPLISFIPFDSFGFLHPPTFRPFFSTSRRSDPPPLTPARVHRREYPKGPKGPARDIRTGAVVRYAFRIRQPKGAACPPWGSLPSPPHGRVWVVRRELFRKKRCLRRSHS